MKKRFAALFVIMSLCVGLLSGCGAYKYDAPTQAEESGVYIEPIDGISDDFYRGVDASAVLSIEKSGAKYYDFDGNEQDVFKTLADSGVNYIRLRVWNDPFDRDGNGYGGGNCDTAAAIEMGKRATEYGMKVLIDYHYSDFWADPNKQMAPKEWAHLTFEDKTAAIYDFTVDSLSQLLSEGVDVGMVQIGNEINYGLSGETDKEKIDTLLIQASMGVRDTADKNDKEIKIAVHFTNLNNEGEVDGLLADLEAAGLDYDAVGLSYYTFWHGSMENMTEVVKGLIEKYGKEFFIAETSQPYTTEDGDGFPNSIEGLQGDLYDGYAATVQSQATLVRDVCAATVAAGGSGVFYWEPTWIPVGDASSDNSKLWEEFGSGWASSYAGKYDPEDAGKYYGGSSWDNQAMFDFTGHPLDSLKVWRYLKYGSISESGIDYVPEVNLEFGVGKAIDMPQTVPVIYKNRAENKDAPVTWDEAQVSAIDPNTGGEYDIDGTMEDGSKITAHVKVTEINYVKNFSFEDMDRSMWRLIYNTSDSGYTDYQQKEGDAHTGEMALHWWSGTADMDFAIEQSITDIEAGTYRLQAFSQGGDYDGTESLELYVITAEGERTQSFTLTSYADWQNPVIDDIIVSSADSEGITVGVRYKCGVGSWGTLDDVILNKVD